MDHVIMWFLCDSQLIVLFVYSHYAFTTRLFAKASCFRGCSSTTFILLSGQLLLHDISLRAGAIVMKRTGNIH